MLPVMFDELLARVGPMITTQLTFCRSPLEPGIKLTVSLSQPASGRKYSSMHVGWRVSLNTQSLVVREVCEAIIDKYINEVLVCPSTTDGWRTIAEKFYQI